MKKIRELIKTFENDSNNNLVDQKLPLIRQAISELFSLIKNMDDIKESSSYFDLLDNIQYILAKYYFKSDVELPQDIKRFAPLAQVCRAGKAGNGYLCPACKVCAINACAFCIYFLYEFSGDSISSP